MALEEFQARELTEADKLYCFKRATESMQGSEERWAERAKRPMSDKELAEALGYELGILGGGGGPDTPDHFHRSNGLKVWGSWNVNWVTDAPLRKGLATVAMARQVYGIKKPEEFAEPTLFDFLAASDNATVAGELSAT
jgi:hypothetical protein